VAVVVEQHYPPIEHTLAELVTAARVKKTPAVAAQPDVSLPQQRRITVAEATRHISERLTLQAWVLFDDLLEHASARQEVVVTFWAVLELLKQRQIIVQQHALFGPIRIEQGEVAPVYRGET
jgi:segregation and condensation protein A